MYAGPLPEFTLHCWELHGVIACNPNLFEGTDDGPWFYSRDNGDTFFAKARTVEELLLDDDVVEALRNPEYTRTAKPDWRMPIEEPNPLVDFVVRVAKALWSMRPRLS